MSKYKILYVDEVDSERRRFKTYIHNNDTDVEFITVAPEIDYELNIFVDKILNENYDAIITDHKLNEENSNIQFDGIDLVEAILKRRIEKVNRFSFIDDEDKVRIYRFIVEKDTLYSQIFQSMVIKIN